MSKAIFLLAIFYDVRGFNHNFDMLLNSPDLIKVNNKTKILLKVLFQPNKSWNVPYNLLVRSRNLQNHCTGSTMIDADIMKKICSKVVRLV